MATRGTAALVLSFGCCCSLYAFRCFENNKKRPSKVLLDDSYKTLCSSVLINEVVWLQCVWHHQIFLSERLEFMTAAAFTCSPPAAAAVNNSWVLVGACVVCELLQCSWSRASCWNLNVSTWELNMRLQSSETCWSYYATCEAGALHWSSAPVWFSTLSCPPVFGFSCLFSSSFISFSSLGPPPSNSPSRSDLFLSCLDYNLCRNHLERLWGTV